MFPDDMFNDTFPNQLMKYLADDENVKEELPDHDADDEDDDLINEDDEDEDDEDIDDDDEDSSSDDE